MQRRPVHTDALGYFHDIRAIQHCTNRVQALPGHRQDNQCQSRPP